MNLQLPSKWRFAASRLGPSLAAFAPGILAAHPGHYHPDETDEFDLLRALFFHSHGSLNLVVALIAMAGLVSACSTRQPSLRWAGWLVAMVSIIMLSAS